MSDSIHEVDICPLVQVKEKETSCLFVEIEESFDVQKVGGQYESADWLCTQVSVGNFRDAPSS